MLSKNEWDPLKTVIVGIADDASIPFLDPSIRLVNYADVPDIKKIPKGKYPDQVIAEANEDLETLCNFLRGEGVEVLRPDKNVKPAYYNYCPRDTVFIHENLILATPTPLQSRANEYKAMSHILEKYGTITVAPRLKTYKHYNAKCLGDPNTLALFELQAAFDAANIIRANDEIFYLVSNSGNLVGTDYLRTLLPDKFIHPIRDVYSYMHIDSTISLLREGLMLLNPARIKNIEQIPECLQSWDIIWCPEPVDIGYYPGYCNASKWINMNLLSVTPNLVIIEERQHNLRKELEKAGIECAMLPGRHQRTLGGGFHCVTLDLIRDHE